MKPPPTTSSRRSQRLNERRREVTRSTLSHKKLIDQGNGTSNQRLPLNTNGKGSVKPRTCGACADTELSLDFSCGMDFDSGILQQMEQKSSTPQYPSKPNKPIDPQNYVPTSDPQLLNLSSSTPIIRRVQENQVSFLTTPSKDTEKKLLLSNWGLPERVLSQYSQRGIESMFEWQAECLMLPNILSGGNLVYSAPTSAGKTLVAELLMLKCVLETKRKGIIILPFVSIAHEKLNTLQTILGPQGIKIGGFMGNQSPPGGFSSVDIAVCTIEKANSLINRLLEERAVHDLGVVVVDELHMIGDEHRGYLLELLLTKLIYVGRTRKNCSQNIQIIAMSATLPNINTLAKWLNAELYCTDFRPTPLQEMVKIGPTLYDTDFKKLREFNQSESIPGDEDDILLVCRERLLEGHSVLIFCPTKAWCENLASTLAEAQTGFISCNANGLGVINSHELIGVCEQLRRTQVGLDHILEKTIPNGVAFHHAGLTFEEREIVEGAFRQTLIKILVATSTLSSGVNLPARLVIVRTPFFQRSLVDILVYKQMVGRAGRKGVDELGESILMCKPSERPKIIGLFKSAPKLIRSCLCSQAKSSMNGNKSSDLTALKRALLEVVSSGVATTKQEINLYASCTLNFTELEQESSLAERSDPMKSMTGCLDTTLMFLLQTDFVFFRTKRDIPPEGDTPAQEYYPTQLGVATISSALSPDEALVVFRELRKARRNFILENELHIIYLVTPVYIQNQWPSIDWYRYLCIWERLSPDMKHVSDILGIKESFLAQAVQGRIPGRTESQRESLRVHRRFYTALALHDLVHEVPIMQVARRYGATKGLLQTLQSAAGTFAGMVTVFCNRLGWTNLELLLSQFQNRLTFGVEKELCELVRIPLLNGFRARVLYNSGYHTLAALATANPTVIEACLRNAVPFKSYKLAAGEDKNATTTCNTWCAKLKKGMTETDAALFIVNEAKNIISKNLNVPLSAWDPVCFKEKKIPWKTPMKRYNSHKSSLANDLAKTKLRRKSPNSHPGDEMGSKKPCMDLNLKSTEDLVPLHGEGSYVRARAAPFSEFDAAQILCPNFIPVSTLIDISPPQTIHPSDSSPEKVSSKCMEPILKATCKLRKPLFELSPINIHDDAAFNPITLPEVGNSFIPDSFNSNPIECTPEKIPDSLPCSADVSMSFSFRTLAMIDAVCDAEVNAIREADAIASYDPIKAPITSMSHAAMNSADTHKTNSCNISTEKTPLKHNSSRCIPETPSSFNFHLSGLKELSSLCSSQLSQSGVTVINVTSNQVLFDTFVSECLEQKSVAVSVAYTSLDQSDGIGSVVVKPKSTSGIPLPRHNEQVVGLAFCWGGMDVYYISLCQEFSSDNEVDMQYSTGPVKLVDRIEAVRKLFETDHDWEMIAYDMKKHARLLALSCGIMPAAKTRDPVVANWMLNPDAKEKTIHRMVLQYLPDQPLLSECEDYEEMSLSSLATNGGDPEMCASAESILAYMLNSKLTILLEAESLYNAYISLEMPSLLVLAKIELNGIGFSPDECTNQRDILQRRVSELEQEAYNIAGHTFSLTSPEDVASVLFIELKLPSGSDLTKQGTLGTSTRRVTRKRIQHLSTAKDVLEKIQSFHPLPGIILEWRKISATMTKIVYPLFKEAVPHTDLESFRIYSNVHIHTATGRISISDPSLQMVPKEFDIGPSPDSSNSLISDSQCLKVSDTPKRDCILLPSTVSIRNTFQPFPGAVFLAADYSQLELRMLAHMSGDAKLKRFLNSEGDVFKMIAGEWLGLAASSVSNHQRQETKQVCYGMLYGIGPKALGEQLNTTDNEAAQFMETFKSKYPTMRKFISKTIQDCRDSGLVTTLLGRKRFLPGIHSTNIHARNKAERQAVNTTIQGSAADLVKTAMINVDRKLSNFYNAKATYLLPSNGKSAGHAAYLVLQLHDELIYEVLEGDVEEVVKIVKWEMENALELSVRFPVKIKTGYSWGKLEPVLF